MKTSPQSHHAPFASQQHLHRALESRIQTRLQFFQRLGLNAQNASCRLQAHEGLQERTSLAIGVSFASKSGRRSKRNAFEPSESARSG